MPGEIAEMSGLTDDELVLQAQGGDGGAFGELMRRTTSTTMSLALGILRDRQEAEDQLQNSYWSAWQHVGDFQRESRFSTWVSRIVINQCLMRLRNLRAARVFSLDENSPEALPLASPHATPEDSLSGREICEMLRHEIRRLPPLLRDTLILRDLDELSTPDAAKRLRISPAAVKARLRRARRALRSRLAENII